MQIPVDNVVGVHVRERLRNIPHQLIRKQWHALACPLQESPKVEVELLHDDARVVGLEIKIEHLRATLPSLQLQHQHHLARACVGARVSVLWMRSTHNNSKSG
jgi:hypothetical protein